MADFFVHVRFIISWAILRILHLVNNTWKTLGLTEICSADVQIILDRLPTIGAVLMGYSFGIWKVQRPTKVLIQYDAFEKAQNTYFKTEGSWAMPVSPHFQDGNIHEIQLLWGKFPTINLIPSF